MVMFGDHDLRCIQRKFGTRFSYPYRSVVGVTALIFVAKGNVAGQILTVVFAIFYGTVSYYKSYYGEMITYLGMSAPAAVIAAISWIKHPDETKTQVKVNTLNKPKIIIMIISTTLITVAFFFILRALGNADLTVSTISVATSFLASYLSILRNEFYAIAYAANDIVLIILWGFATAIDRASLPMIICFAMFLINDIYGFINWLKMKKQQNK